LPPVAATVAEYAALTLPPVSGEAVVILSAGAIVTDRFLVAVACVGLLESVTVTATVLVPDAVGVPPIAPVDAFSVRPAGSPVAVHVYGALPPLATRVAPYAVFTAPLGRDVVVMATAGAIVNVKFLVAVRCVGLVESVTVTATVLVPAAVGVPLIAPVDAFSVRPAGNPVVVQLY
jgi:hypothetical protein